MKIKITTNFDFKKLSGSVDKIVNSYEKQMAKDSVVGAKKKIDSGLKPVLKSSTKKQRAAQGFPKTPPLKKSKRLYNSLKSDSNKLNVIAYGFWHNYGINNRSPQREFINTRTKHYFETRKQRKSAFIKELRKNLKK